MNSFINWTYGFIQDVRGCITPSELLRKIIRDPSISRDYTYVVLGKGGPTGKTWLTSALSQGGYRAIEISERITGLVDYLDSDNHCMVDHFHKTVIIVLNRPLQR